MVLLLIPSPTWLEGSPSCNRNPTKKCDIMPLPPLSFDIIHSGINQLSLFYFILSLLFKHSHANITHTSSLPTFLKIFITTNYIPRNIRFFFNVPQVLFGNKKCHDTHLPKRQSCPSRASKPGTEVSDGTWYFLMYIWGNVLFIVHRPYNIYINDDRLIYVYDIRIYIYIHTYSLRYCFHPSL